MDWEIEGDAEEEVLQDFKIKPYLSPYESFEKGYQAIPMDFYDNDDGYWDDHIAKKNEKYQNYAMEEMIVGRPFLKH